MPLTSFDLEYISCAIVLAKRKHTKIYSFLSLRLWREDPRTHLEYCIGTLVFLSMSNYAIHSVYLCVLFNYV